MLPHDFSSAVLENNASRIYRAMLCHSVIHTPSVNWLTSIYFCSVTGYDMLASFTALASRHTVVCQQPRTTQDAQCYLQEVESS